MVNIYYTRFKDKLPDSHYEFYLNQLSDDIREKNMKFRRWQDRHSHLFGKLLLIKGLELLGLHASNLSELKQNKYGRPYLNNEIDFNISHSGEFVLCAIGRGIRLGIDIEWIHDINFEDFNKVMTNLQWHNINHSKSPTTTFFKYWTIKESVIKADSRGLSIPLLDINIENDKVSYDDQTWYLNELHVNDNYYSYLATNEESVDILMHNENFYSENSIYY